MAELGGSERDALHTDALGVLKRVIKGRGGLSGVFYLAHGPTETALVLERAVRDPTGARTLIRGRELKRSVDATAWARGRLLYEHDALRFRVEYVRGNLKTLRQRLYKRTRAVKTPVAQKLARLLITADFSVDVGVVERLDASPVDELPPPRALTDADLDGLGLDSIDVSALLLLEAELAEELEHLDGALRGVEGTDFLRGASVRLEAEAYGAFFVASELWESEDRRRRWLERHTAEVAGLGPSSFPGGWGEGDAQEEGRAWAQVREASQLYTQVRGFLRAEAPHPGLSPAEADELVAQLDRVLERLDGAVESNRLPQTMSALDDGFAVMDAVARAHLAAEITGRDLAIGLEHRRAFAPAGRLHDRRVVLVVSGVPFECIVEGGSAWLTAVWPPPEIGTDAMLRAAQAIDAVYDLCESEPYQPLDELTKPLENTPAVTSVRWIDPPEGAFTLRNGSPVRAVRYTDAVAGLYGLLERGVDETVVDTVLLQRASEGAFIELELSPRDHHVYVAAQKGIAVFLPVEGRRPTIHLVLRGVRSGRRSSLGVIGGTGPLSDAQMLEHMLALMTDAQVDLETLYLEVLSAPPPRGPVEMAFRGAAYAYGLRQFCQQGPADLASLWAWEYTIRHEAIVCASNTAHLALGKVGDAITAGTLRGLLKARFQENVVDLVDRVVAYVGSGDTEGVRPLVLGTANAYTQRLYPSRFAKLGIRALELPRNAGTTWQPERAELLSIEGLDHVAMQAFIDFAKSNGFDAAVANTLTELIRRVIGAQRPTHLILGCTELGIALNDTHFSELAALGVEVVDTERFFAERFAVLVAKATAGISSGALKLRYGMPDDAD